MKKTKRKAAKSEPIKLDLSYGPVVQPEFIRKPLHSLVDKSVAEIYSSFLFNRIPGALRPQFMDECWRVLVPGGKLTILVPYWSSCRAVQDYGHAWPPVVEQSFLYFNRQWRIDQKQQAPEPAVVEWDALEGHDYQIKADFDFTFGYLFDPETAARAEDVRSSWIKHYVNSVTDLQVTLTKKG